MACTLPCPLKQKRPGNALGVSGSNWRISGIALRQGGNAFPDQPRCAAYRVSAAYSAAIGDAAGLPRQTKTLQYVVRFPIGGTPTAQAVSICCMERMLGSQFHLSSIWFHRGVIQITKRAKKRWVPVALMHTAARAVASTGPHAFTFAHESTTHPAQRVREARIKKPGPREVVRAKFPAGTHRDEATFQSQRAERIDEAAELPTALAVTWLPVVRSELPPTPPVTPMP